MPTRKRTTTKTATRSKEEPVQAERVSTKQTSDEISYETKLTIVILLLLFVYPLGLVFMWFWMRNWPLWLKILISLPVVIGIVAFFIGIFAISLIIRHVATDRNFQNQMWKYQQQYRQYQLSPSPSETMVPTDTIPPTTSDSNSGTY